MRQVISKGRTERYEQTDALTKRMAHATLPALPSTNLQERRNVISYLATAENVGVFVGHGGDAALVGVGAVTGTGGVRCRLSDGSRVQGVSSPPATAISLLRRELEESVT